jgi:hypothetical protein
MVPNGRLAWWLPIMDRQTSDEQIARGAANGGTMTSRSEEHDKCLANRKGAAASWPHPVSPACSTSPGVRSLVIECT